MGMGRRERVAFIIKLQRAGGTVPLLLERVPPDTRFAGLRTLAFPLKAGLFQRPTFFKRACPGIFFWCTS